MVPSSSLFRSSESGLFGHVSNLTLELHYLSSPRIGLHVWSIVVSSGLFFTRGDLFHVSRWTETEGSFYRNSGSLSWLWCRDWSLLIKILFKSLVRPWSRRCTYSNCREGHRSLGLGSREILFFRLELICKRSVVLSNRRDQVYLNSGTDVETVWRL